MNRLETADRFAQLWKVSREDVGVSQDYMAKSLGVSKKTIQNWESGYSSPSIMTAFEWFDVLGVSFNHYYIKVFHGDSDLTDLLLKCVASLPPKEKEELLYILAGNHGSEPSGLLSMLTAHLHVPLKDRLNIANSIMTNYEVAEAQDNLINKGVAAPSIDILKESYLNANASVKAKKESYTNRKVNNA